MTPEQADVCWRKSSRSSGQGQCVEVAVLGGRIGVRDSTAPEAGRLVISSGSFADLLACARRGDLDVER